MCLVPIITIFPIKNNLVSVISILKNSLSFINLIRIVTLIIF